MTLNPSVANAARNTFPSVKSSPTFTGSALSSVDPAFPEDFLVLVFSAITAISFLANSAPSHAKNAGLPSSTENRFAAMPEKASFPISVRFFPIRISTCFSLALEKSSSPIFAENA